MKIIFNKFRFNYLIFLSLFLLVLLGGVAYVIAEGVYSQGWRVNNGSTRYITIYDGATCRKVDNYSGKDLFIPTKTAAEWNAFSANKPGGVTIAGCCEVTNNCASYSCSNNDVYCVNNCGNYTTIATDCGPLAGSSFMQAEGDGWCQPEYMRCETNGLFYDAYERHVRIYTYDGTCSGASCRTTASPIYENQVGCPGGHIVTTPVGCTCASPVRYCDCLSWEYKSCSNNYCTGCYDSVYPMTNGTISNPRPYCCDGNWWANTIAPTFNGGCDTYTGWYAC